MTNQLSDHLDDSPVVADIPRRKVAAAAARRRLAAAARRVGPAVAENQDCRHQAAVSLVPIVAQRVVASKVLQPRYAAVGWQQAYHQQK